MASFSQQKVLIVGATSGIGLAFAEKLISLKRHVIAVGRRQERLTSLQKKYGEDLVSIYQFDITDLDGIPGFVAKVTKEHPDLASVILNSGIQRGLDWTKPQKIDLSLISTEFTTNYLSHVHLTAALLPFFLSKQTNDGNEKNVECSLVFISSGLALVPLMRCGNYCASKAAMHSLVMTMREQLRGTNVKITEIYPPAVETELHDEENQPELGGSKNIPMKLSIEEFMEGAWRGLEEGKEDIPVGMVGKRFWEFEGRRVEMFREITGKMRGQKK